MMTKTRPRLAKKSGPMAMTPKPSLYPGPGTSSTWMGPVNPQRYSAISDYGRAYSYMVSYATSPRIDPIYFVSCIVNEFA